MLRTTAGVSFLVLFGVLSACSSKATDSNTTGGTGGNGALLGGSSTGGATGNGAGTTANSAGKTATAGTSMGGLDGGACTDEGITCVDEINAMGCNFDTGVVDTFSCVEEYAALGFTASGCTMDAAGDNCEVTGVIDAACQQGALAFGHCEGATADQQIFNIYVNCFQNFMQAHTIIPCFIEYVTPAKMTANDCLRAEEACLPGAGGAGPTDAGGAGGAP